MKIGTLAILVLGVTGVSAGRVAGCYTASCHPRPTSHDYHPEMQLFTVEHRLQLVDLIGGQGRKTETTVTTINVLQKSIVWSLSVTRLTAEKMKSPPSLRTEDVVGELA